MNVATFITALVTALGSSRALVAFSIDGDQVSVTTERIVGDAILTDKVQRAMPADGDEAAFATQWGQDIIGG